MPYAASPLTPKVNSFCFYKEQSTIHLDSPTSEIYQKPYFSQTLHADVKDFNFPGKSILLQYINNFYIPLYFPTLKASHIDPFLQQLANKGYNISKDKLRFCSASIKFLGHLLTPDGLKIEPDRTTIITQFPQA